MVVTLYLITTHARNESGRVAIGMGTWEVLRLGVLINWLLIISILPLLIHSVNSNEMFVFSCPFLDSIGP